MSSLNQSNVIAIHRLYDAPLREVWDAWAVSEQICQWWGPRGFTLTVHDRDLKSGGHWHYTMHGPDGTDYENTTQYLEVLPMQKLVYDHGGHKDRPPLFRVTAQFKSIRGVPNFQWRWLLHRQKWLKQCVVTFVKLGARRHGIAWVNFLPKRHPARKYF